MRGRGREDNTELIKRRTKMSGVDRVARKGEYCEIWRTEQARNERARGLRTI